MNTAFDKFQKQRLISSYFSVVLSIALVLFLMGLLGVLVLNTKKIGDHFKEQVHLVLFLADDTSDQQIKEISKALSEKPYTKSMTFISKDEAAQAQEKDLGENFVEFLGFNPLKNALDVQLNAEFVDPTTIAEAVAEWEATKGIAEVSYDQPLIGLLNENITKMTLWILVVSGIFSLVAFLLINSSIRLSIYAKRFIIKTMQMVGATPGFIRKPFILTNVKLGLIGAVMADIFIGIVLWRVQQSIPELDVLGDIKQVAWLFLGVPFLGMSIAGISTFWAAQRFLKLRTAELYD
ncbi:MAG: permease-like cell division protein FtsX [Flavobacteriaceae bacterium]|jgi:cell division transport system permease protein|nr:permease-like cell division protein FtsX [Flavobacteriaceae bacterium]MDP4754490.1 permease-like cell division protein FtsX [Flavobacteriaceae bacterium]MDP4970375.1 permease-like cell division protein FtsX [Flavobacteriaceae bacterium]